MVQVIPQKAAGSDAGLPLPDDALIRLAGVETLTGLKKSSIYALVRARRFPPPIKLSRRCVAWSRNAVQAWVQARIVEGGAL